MPGPKAKPPNRDNRLGAMRGVPISGQLGLLVAEQDECHGTRRPSPCDRACVRRRRRWDERSHGRSFQWWQGDVERASPSLRCAHGFYRCCGAGLHGRLVRAVLIALPSGHGAVVARWTIPQRSLSDLFLRQTCRRRTRPEARLAAPATTMHHAPAIEKPDTSSMPLDTTSRTMPPISTSVPTQASRVPRDFGVMAAQ